MSELPNDDIPEPKGFDLIDNPYLGVFFTSESIVGPSPKPPPLPKPPSTPRVQGEMQVIIATCNVRNVPNLPRRAVERAGSILSDKTEIIGLQEMGDDGRDIRDFQAGLGKKWGIAGRSATPIAYRKDLYTLVQSRHVKVTDGIAGVNPDRGYDIATFKTSKGVVFYVLNTHLHNKAYNGPADPHKKWRRQSWDKVWAAIKNEVNNNKGPMFVTGDFNRVMIPSQPPNFAWVAGYNRIDKIGLKVNRDVYRPMAGNVRKVNTSSDHDAIVVKVTLRKRT